MSNKTKNTERDGEARPFEALVMCTEQGYLEIERFNELYETLVDDTNREDVIELLAVAVHSEACQKVITNKYLEHKGYDVEEVGKRGVKFIKDLLNK